jgi:lysophospholipase L1-like esterase
MAAVNRPAIAFGVSLGVLALVALGTELGFRVLVPAADEQPIENLRHYLLSGRPRGYEPRAYTVYQRPRNTESVNANGFGDRPWTRARTPGVPRIACLGGSTTAGGNAQGRRATYPFQLELVLEQRTGRDFEVMNAGIAGWTSAEMLVAWFLTIQDFQPDVVVLHEAVNDLEPRFLAGFEPDYSHWRRPMQTHPATGLERALVRVSDLYLHLQLRSGRAPEILDVTSDRSAPKEPMTAEGKLPYATSLAFRRNILSIARSARDDGREVVLMTLPMSPTVNYGAFWRYGIAQNNRHLRELASEHELRLADADRAFEARPELAAEFTDSVHLQSAGNLAKAELVADALADWVTGLAPEGARPPNSRE